jgi:hypothetical protein
VELRVPYLGTGRFVSRTGRYNARPGRFSRELPVPVVRTGRSKRENWKIEVENWKIQVENWKIRVKNWKFL